MTAFIAYNWLGVNVSPEMISRAGIVPNLAQTSFLRPKYRFMNRIQGGTTGFCDGLH
jgi:hypothetical protein